MISDICDLALICPGNFFLNRDYYENLFHDAAFAEIDLFDKKMNYEI